MSTLPATALPRAACALAIAITALLAGCRTPPPPNPALEAARQALQQAAADPHVAQAAGVELQAARADLQRADLAWNEQRDPALTAHLSHLAHQRALIAGQLGLQHAAETRLAAAAQQREQLRADAARRGAPAAVAAEPPPQAPTALAPVPRVLTPQPVDVPAAAPAASPAPATAAPPAAPAAVPAQSAPFAERPPRSTRFDDETAARARMQLETERRRADATRAAPPAAAPATQVAAVPERDSALQQQLERLNARPTPRGMVLTLPDVLFDSGGATLRPGHEATLDRIVGVMQRFPERRVLLEGFTDDVGAETVNYDLSQRRAEAFRAALLARGAEARRIDVSAQGEAFPVAGNDTAAGRAQNRRVEVIFSDARGRFAPR